MKPADYLARVEPIVIALFEALLQAERKARETQWINGHVFQHYQYQLDRWSQTENYNGIGSLNYADAYVRVEEAKQAIRLTGIPLIGINCTFLMSILSNAR